MTISQIPGATRLRRNQYGIQTVLNTAVAATRRVPWRGGPVVNPNWTDPDVDLGSLDPIAPPYRGAFEVGQNTTGVLYYNDLPLRLLAGLKGGVAPTGAGTAKTWDFQIASLTSDDFDVFSNEYGDDTEATDGIISVGGVIDTLEESMPQDLGPWTISDQWVYSKASLGANLTDDLDVDDDGILVMGDHSEIKMDTSAGAIGTTKLTDTWHDATIRVQNALDKKRFANGSNGANQLGGYGRGPRVIELVLTFAKTAEIIAERATLLTEPKPARFFEVMTASPSEAQTGIPYSYRRRGAFRLFEVSEGEIGGNATLQFTYRAFYHSGLGYAYAARVINTMTTAVDPA